MSHSRKRSGFTLVELLVVLFIIALIGGLAAFFWPGFSQRERAAQGASNVHQWLLIARQRALLDQAPRGVRFFLDPASPQVITKAQFIEQPDDFTGGLVMSKLIDPTKNQYSTTVFTFSNVDLQGGFGLPELWPVQPGDYIQFHGSGLMHQILKINSATELELIPTSPLGYPITTATKNYKIVRKPRLQGGEPMDMPADIGIDLSTNSKYGKPLPVNSVEGAIDVLFAPSGTVMGNAASDKLYFWVRDMSYGNELDGEPSIVVVYMQSGLVATYPVDTLNAVNPLGKVK